MRRIFSVFITALLLAIFVLVNARVWDMRLVARAEMPAGYVLPSKFSRVLAFGNKGLLSDFLFLKTLTFFGGKFGRDITPSEQEWNFLYVSLDVITDLDPYFVDPYMLAEGLLAWDAGLPEKANVLLAKGMSHRPKDWRWPFFIGFNHFYFLKNYAVASDHIRHAASLPGSPFYLKTLAGRLAYYGGKSKTGLLFLQQMVEETDDELLRRRLEKRLLALQRAVAIEDALAAFKTKEGRMPTSLREIVARGYLPELPADPYGGKWYVLDTGRVFSTSKFTEVPQSQEKTEQ